MMPEEYFSKLARKFYFSKKPAKLKNITRSRVLVEVVSRIDFDFGRELFFGCGLNCLQKAAGISKMKRMEDIVFDAGRKYNKTKERPEIEEKTILAAGLVQNAGLNGFHIFGPDNASKLGRIAKLAAELISKAKLGAGSGWLMGWEAKRGKRCKSLYQKPFVPIFFGFPDNYKNAKKYSKMQKINRGRELI